MSIILRISTQIIVQLMLLISILLLLRGHNYPGGGFVGALVGVCSIALIFLAFGFQGARFYGVIRLLILTGLICCTLSLLLGMFSGGAMLSATWGTISLAGTTFKLGSPLLFDIGVYSLILGSVAWTFAMLEAKSS